MSEAPDSPLRFVGMTGGDLGSPYEKLDIGAVVTVEYAGSSYRARITARYDDYDDFGTEVSRYDLEVTGPG